MNARLAKSVALVLASTFTVLGGCDDDDGASFEDFQDRAHELAGSNATDCGHADVDQYIEQNTCIGSAFVAQNAAFATYEGSGVDSRVAEGWAITVGGKVYRLSFDGDPNQSDRLDDGVIYVTDCLNASLSGIVDGRTTEVFNCD